MNDGNSAALSRRDDIEDMLEARHEAYGERAIESIVDDLFRGKGLGRHTVHEFCHAVTNEEIGAMLLTRDMSDIDKKVTSNIKDWCADSVSGQSLVAERERELDEGE